jgi:hypothetical protein
MPTTHTVWVSDCGQYYALAAPSRRPAYDVLEVHGPGVWLSQRYEPQGWQDTDRRYTHAEFPHMTLGWSLRGGWNRTRTRFDEAFEQAFGDLRQDLQCRPLSARRADLPAGAHVLTVSTATFTKQRRVSRASWNVLQQRIADATLAGHASLYAHATAEEERRAYV